MVFKQFSLENVTYEWRKKFVYQIGADKPVSLDTTDMKMFFEVLALCHSVQLDKRAKTRYQASSPDEYSFVMFCEKYLLNFNVNLYLPALKI